MLSLKECEAHIKSHIGVGLQVSGGRDSIATLLYLKPFWDLLTVYWMNPGDPVPETRELMDKIKATVPNFVEIVGNVKANRATSGIPVDVVPQSLTMLELVAKGTPPLFYARPSVDCCYTNRYLPLYNRMREDNITLIIRGEKEGDTYRNHVLSQGFVDPEGRQYLFPIYDETDDSVMEYLHDQDPEWIHPIYQYGASGCLDCLGCTGWWYEHTDRFLADRYPEQYKSRRIVVEEVKRQTIALFDLLD